MTELEKVIAQRDWMLLIVKERIANAKSMQACSENYVFQRIIADLQILIDSVEKDIKS